MSMGLGQQVAKLISWKVEEMLVTQNHQVEDLKHFVLLYIGVLIGLRISIQKLGVSTLIPLELWVMIFISMGFIGTISRFILTLMMIQKEFFK